jgi:hypothetical protein
MDDIVAQYRDTRLARLALKKDYDELEDQEKRLKEQIIIELRKGVAFPTPVILIEKQKPTVEDWHLLYEHIQATGNFELLQRRVTESAVQERWANGDKVPGVGRFPVFDIKVG